MRAKKNKLYENSNDISNLQNESKSKSIENNDKTDQKFMNKPPKNFNTKEAKELKKEFIEVCDEDKIGDANNFWYKKFKYLGKKYIMETKKKYAKIKEFIIYYCHLHCTTIESDKTNKEGNKLKTAKCYSRVYYYKSNKKFLMDWDRSPFCDKL